jgi:hypothetical protein
LKKYKHSLRHWSYLFKNVTPSTRYLLPAQNQFCSVYRKKTNRSRKSKEEQQFGMVSDGGHRECSYDIGGEVCEETLCFVWL